MTARLLCSVLSEGLSPCLLVLFLALPLRAAAQNQRLEIVKLADGVYSGIYSEFRMDPVEGNSLIVIGDDGVLVLDSGRTPDAARTMIGEIRKLTPKPVRYIVNSHWHDDHIFGNQAYQETFPGVEFIAHANTRDDMEKEVVPGLTKYGTEYWTKMADDFDKRLSGGTRPDGTPLTEAQKERLREQVRTLREFIPKTKSLRVVFPTLAIRERLSVHLGGREIQLIHFGPGNTRGDVAVYLPGDRILATGDLLVHPVPLAYGSNLAEWIETLRKLRTLQPATIVPGHGPIMRDTAYLDTVTELFSSVVTQVNDAVARGLTLEETRKAVNLDSFRTRLAGDDPFQRNMFADSILREAVTRTYNAAKASREPANAGRSGSR